MSESWLFCIYCSWIELIKKTIEIAKQYYVTTNNLIDSPIIFLQDLSLNCSITPL